VEDGSCLFCCEPEIASHLFFECCVASVFWKNIMKLWACRLVLILNQ
jgi:hypothetical protein